MLNSIQYVLLTKPAALTMADWATSLTLLQKAINKRSDDPQPIRRLHTRRSTDGSMVLLHGDFDEEDVTVNGAATVVKAALGSKYTLTQIKTALTNNIKVLSHAEALTLVAGPEWETAI